MKSFCRLLWLCCVGCVVLVILAFNHPIFFYGAKMLTFACISSSFHLCRAPVLVRSNAAGHTQFGMIQPHEWVRNLKEIFVHAVFQARFHLVLARFAVLSRFFTKIDGFSQPVDLGSWFFLPIVFISYSTLESSSGWCPQAQVWSWCLLVDPILVRFGPNSCNGITLWVPGHVSALNELQSWRTNHGLDVWHHWIGVGLCFDEICGGRLAASCVEIPAFHLTGTRLQAHFTACPPSTCCVLSVYS